MVCTLTLTDLINLLIEQRGCCAYSGIPFNHTQTGSWRMSLERRDTKKGYTLGNVCLIVREMNSMDYSHDNYTEDQRGAGWSIAKYNIVRNHYNK